ncbi:hypothetical protein GWI33_014419 [Rhynchophorus ferrugineus]|uniref:Uncharacterized protein n=1 Tax=Rhynchophorus ferrugineus TaxID=354439 RepID=A0A834I653_RHYFE|nr:hypothetical protein GWI33_014419 [Rhynchophorus ferrugineus]
MVRNCKLGSATGSSLGYGPLGAALFIYDDKNSHRQTTFNRDPDGFIASVAGRPVIPSMNKRKGPPGGVGVATERTDNSPAI